jgi:hypothetical protein
MPETPASIKGPASKRVVVDAIVLAFSKSDVRDVVGTDALKMVLEGRYLEMIKTPGVLSLQPVWDLLLSQEGVTADQVKPVFSKIKQWENRLNVPIVLPKDLEELTSVERDRLAQNIRVPDEELARILNPGSVAAPRPKSVRSVPVAAAPQLSGGIKDLGVPPSKTRKMVAFALFTVGVLGAGISAVWALGGGKVESLTPAQVSTEIPLKGARRSGETIGAVLADKNAWMQKSQADRRRMLEQAFEKTQSLGAARFVLMDDKGEVFGHAQLGEDGKPQATVQ